MKLEIPTWFKLVVAGWLIGGPVVAGIVLAVLAVWEVASDWRAAWEEWRGNKQAGG